MKDLNNQFKDGDEVNGAILVEKGLIKNEKLPIKVLANGKINIKLTIQINAISKTAKHAIESVGGKVEVL